MKLLDRERPMRAIHRKTGEVGTVRKGHQSKMLLVAEERVDGWQGYFDRYGNPKDDFCPWRVENIPSAFDGIKAGLEDALAYAQGDTSRGKVIGESSYTEAVMELGSQSPEPNNDWTEWTGSPNAPDDWDGGKVLLRNGNIVTGPGEYGRWHWADHSKYGHPLGTVGDDIVGYKRLTTPVDKALWERVVGLVRDVAAMPDYVVHNRNLSDEARAIAELLGPVVDVDLIEARKLAMDADGYNHHSHYDDGKKDDSKSVKLALTSIKRGRTLERGA